MRFILIDFLALLAVGGLGVTAWTTIRYTRANTLKGKIEEARQLGEKNAEVLALASELVCGVCSERVDPFVDLHLGGEWFHQRCYEQSTV